MRKLKEENKGKVLKDVTNQGAAQIGNAFSANVQAGTDAAIKGMDLFRFKAERTSNVNYEQAKGNLFEYIESAKLTKNMANAGVKAFDKTPLTDAPSNMGGFGEPHAPDDFRFIRDGKVIGSGQAKVNNDTHKAAVNFTNPKYNSMQRNAPSDVIKDIQNHLDEMVQKGEISRAAYEDATANLRGALTDPSSGISSGGTSTKELEQFRGADGKISKEAALRYARGFEMKQYAVEVGTTTVNGAASGAVINGILSGTKNLFQVYQNKMELKAALEEVGADIVKGGARGGATGFLSSLLRIGGTKANLSVVSDASAATVIAGSIIDGGAAIYAYGKGEISSEQLKEELQNTLVKSTATIYFTKAVKVVVGSANPFVSMAIYSVASYVVTCTREIIKNAELNAKEYRRLAALNDEAANLIVEFRKQMEEQMSQYAASNRAILYSFLSEFQYNLDTGENYDRAIYAMVNFANQTSLVLQHADFSEFIKAMISNKEFTLK